MLVPFQGTSNVGGKIHAGVPGVMLSEVLPPTSNFLALPSQIFHVLPENQIWHSFNIGVKSSDRIGFIWKY